MNFITRVKGVCGTENNRQEQEMEKQPNMKEGGPQRIIRGQAAGGQTQQGRGGARNQTDTRTRAGVTGQKKEKEEKGHGSCVQRQEHSAQRTEDN